MMACVCRSVLLDFTVFWGFFFPNGTTRIDSCVLCVGTPVGAIYICLFPREQSEILRQILDEMLLTDAGHTVPHFDSLKKPAACVPFPLVPKVIYTWLWSENSASLIGVK